MMNSLFTKPLAAPPGTADPGEELVSAAQRGDIPRVRELLAKRVNPNSTKNTATALLWAAWAGNHELTTILLKAGADPNVQDGARRTALMFAVSGPQFPTGAEVTVKALLDGGADVRLQDANGDTALSWAKRGRAAEIIVPGSPP